MFGISARRQIHNTYWSGASFADPRLERSLLPHINQRASSSSSVAATCLADHLFSLLFRFRSNPSQRRSTFLSFFCRFSGFSVSFLFSKKSVCVSDVASSPASGMLGSASCLSCVGVIGKNWMRANEKYSLISTAANGCQQTRSFATNWSRLQRGRRRLVHISYPPTRRSLVYKILPKDAWYAFRDAPSLRKKSDDGSEEQSHGSTEALKERPPTYRSCRDYKEKLVFVCYGYYDRLEQSLLSPHARRQLRGVRNPKARVADGKLEWRLVQDAVKRTEVTCLGFATGRTHHLLETLTLQEVLELEKLSPKIHEAFREARKMLPQQEEQDKQSRHYALPLHDLPDDPAAITPNLSPHDLPSVDSRPTLCRTHPPQP